MKKFTVLRFSVLFIVFIIVSETVQGQGSETFTNLPTNSSSSYLGRSWTGDDGVIWTAEGARTDQTINGKAICWGNSGTRNLITPAYSGGMGTLSFNYVRGFTGTSARSLEVYVNNELKASFAVSATSNDVVQFSQEINLAGNVVLEIRSTGAAQVKVDDVLWTTYTGGGNLPPSISNILQDPATGITSSTTVSVSADVTDSDGTVGLVELRWGTTTGVYPNTIQMSLDAGSTYVTNTDIPAQLNGTTVYYVVYAKDDDEDGTTSSEQSFTVTDPVFTTLPYNETFDTDLGDTYVYSVAGGSKNWIWDDMGGTQSGHAYMNGFGGSNPEEDWLILPGINFDNYTGEIMQFYTFYEYGSEDANNYLKLYYSTDYAGVGNPAGATWTVLPFIQASSWGEWQPSFIVDLSGIIGTEVYIGFKYYSTDAPRSWRVDDISIFEGSLVDVTFQVNMAEAVVSGNGVHLAGSFNTWWDPSGIEMFDVDNDEVYTVTLPLYSNIEYQFKYINGDAWGSDENVPVECRAAGTTNRFEVIGASSYAIGPVCFSSCVNCGSLMDYDVTFQVDMQNETVSGDGVYLAGSFTNWQNGAILMTQNGSVWSTSVMLEEGSYQEYKFVNGNPNSGGNWESINNRQLTVPSANTLLGLVCFNSYDPCPVADFVMINEVDSDTPGTDVLEFVELYDGGVGNTDLTGLVVVFYNGNNDLSYAAYDLAGYSTDVNGYFLLGNAAVVPTPSIIFANNFLQNGQDAVALYVGSALDFPNGTTVTTANLIDALVYDTDDADDPGLLVLLNPGQPQINENGRNNGATHSNQRIPNGSGGLRNTDTYDQAYPTPGAANGYTPTTWTGLVSSDWSTNGNWDFGAPYASVDATIPVVGTQYPVVGNAGFCGNLSVDLGASLEISTSGALTVTGTFTNNGSVIIRSGATGTGSLIESNGISATVERYFTGNDVDWHLVSSPVAGATAEVFTGMYLQDFDPITYTYTDIVDPATSLNVMEGYALYSTLGASNTVSFEGNLNAGNQSASFVTGFDAYNWNLLGNPYSSSIDWELVNIPAGMSNEVHYIDAATGADLSYVKGVGGAGSQYIPPMQGFFVSATTGGTFSVGNDQRTHMGSNLFYKNSNPDLVVLQASNGSFSDEAWIHFNQVAEVEHDGKYDAYKRVSLSNPLLPQIFSYTPAGVKLSVNGMPEVQSVPVGFTAVQSGEFTISAKETGGFSEIYLEDLFTGNLTNLLTGSCSFLYNEGDLENRFILHFAPLSVSSSIEKNVNIWSYGNEVVVMVPELTSGIIRIYNMMGQEVVSTSVTSSRNTITVPQRGYYVVTVVSDQTVVTEKVIIR